MVIGREEPVEAPEKPVTEAEIRAYVAKYQVDPESRFKDEDLPF